MLESLSMSTVYKICVGAGILPNEEECSVTSLFHKVLEKKDMMPYNGIRNWRCDKCFAIHRQKVNKKNNE